MFLKASEIVSFLKDPNALQKGKNTVKGATQVSAHSFKLYFYMFQKSKGKHNSLDYHKSFWNIFH
jgi:hypothetical protein